MTLQPDEGCPTFPSGFVGLQLEASRVLLVQETAVERMD